MEIKNVFMLQKNTYIDYRVYSVLRIDRTFFYRKLLKD